MRQISRNVFEYTGIVTRTKDIKCQYCGKAPEESDVKQYQRNRIFKNGSFIRRSRPISRGLNMSGWIAVFGYDDLHRPVYRVCPECYQNGRKK